MDSISELITGMIILLVGVLVVLLGVYFTILLRDKKAQRDLKKSEEISDDDKIETKQQAEKTTTKAASYGNVLDFMDFDGIEDNMIINKESKKYTMVIECKGINYDLMSGIEQAAVEESFIQFLNALRTPIQLHVQTRAINLENNIDLYNKRLDKVKANYIRKKADYERYKQNPNYDPKVAQKLYLELTKEQNLLEYGQDIIADTQRLSLNKNILSKKYFICISYYYEMQFNSSTLDKYEIRDLAFQDLYTKAAAIISNLGSTGVVSHILDSYELAEMLYMSFNRSSAENFGLKRALQANYDKLYSTAPDVFNKKIKALDKEIQVAATLKAQEKLQVAQSLKEQELTKKEEEKDKLINDMARMILESNKKYVGKDLANRAINELKKEADMSIVQNFNGQKEEGGVN